MALFHPEGHRTAQTGWLRAAVLGANDGLISTSSLIIGVASATPVREPVLIAGLAGLVAGALSMAAGEYVSVSSQADTEHADLARERRELETQPGFELAELAGLYEQRGLTRDLAAQVAAQLMAHDALGAHARDELGLSEVTKARPLQAAMASAAGFALGAGLPVGLVAVVSIGVLTSVIGASSLVLLALLGAAAAAMGGAPVVRAAMRVTFWGAVAMVCSWLVGRLFGANV